MYTFPKSYASRFSVFLYDTLIFSHYAVDSGLLSTEISRSSVGEVPVFIECPCGVVKTLVDIEEGKLGRVRFVSVPAFAFGIDVEINTKKSGKVKVEIGIRGVFHATVTGDRWVLTFNRHDWVTHIHI